MSDVPVSVSQNSFTGGAIAPSLYGRYDISRYQSSVRSMKNFIIHPHGGASNRGGTQFIGEVKDSSKRVKLIPFQFSVEQAYVLEFGDQYMRIYKDAGRVVEASVAITGITQADPAVVTTTAAHGASNDDWVYISAVVGMTEVNGSYYRVANATATTYELQDIDGNDIDSTAYTAYSSGGLSERVYEIATPYLEADLPLIKFTQSADVLYLVHPSYAPRKLSRTGHTAWTLSSITFAPSISAPTGLANTGSGTNYKVTAVTDDNEESLASALVDGGVNIATTWNAVTGATYYNVYKEINSGGDYAFLGRAWTTTFTEYTNTSYDPDKTPPIATNPFGATDDYPGVCTFFEQRLVFARTNNNPQTIWGSITGGFENMNKSEPLKDDDAYEFTINARQLNEIRFLVPLNELLIGTSGSEWKMTNGGNADAITPTNVLIRMQSLYGSSDVQPIVIGNTVLFTERSGSIIRDFAYNFDVDTYTGNDLTVFANHFFRDYEVLEWSYQQYPDSVIWCVRDDGKLLGLTYYKEHQVWGWHEHETEGLFENITNIITSEDEDDVYMVVNRTVNGVTRRYVERFMTRLPVNSQYEVEVEDAFFVDSGLSLDSPRTITGITKADPAVVTSNSHGLSNGDYVDITEVIGMTEVNNTRFKIANVTANTFELTDFDDNDIDSTSYTVYSSGGKAREAVSTISGLEHLEGKAVSVLASGNVVTGKVVSNGAIELDDRASRVHVGLGYTSDIETLDLDYPTETGTVQDKKRQILSVIARLENTRALWIGPDEDSLDEVAFRDTEDFGEPIQFYTGDKELFIEEGSDREGRLFIRNTDPVPVSILALITRFSHGSF